MPNYIILILIVLGALLVFVVGKSGSSRSHHDSAFDDVFEEEDEGLFGEGGFEEGDFGDEEEF